MSILYVATAPHFPHDQRRRFAVIGVGACANKAKFTPRVLVLVLASVGGSMGEIANLASSRWRTADSKTFEIRKPFFLQKADETFIE